MWKISENLAVINHIAQKELILDEFKKWWEIQARWTICGFLIFLQSLAWIIVASEHIRSSWRLFTLRKRDLWQTVYILHVIVLYLFSKTNLNNHVSSSKWNVYTPVVRSVCDAFCIIPSYCTLGQSTAHGWNLVNMKMYEKQCSIFW